LAHVTHVTCGDEIDAAADRAALNSGEHWHSALFKAGKGSLHPQNIVVKTSTVLAPPVLNFSGVIAGCIAAGKYRGINTR
jgi:hypothetical protein